MAESLKPSRARNTETVKETPVANRYVRRHVRRIVELLVTASPCFIQISYDVLGDPSPAGHYHRLGFDPIEPAIVYVHHCYEVRLTGVAHMLEAHHRRIEPHPHPLIRSMEGGKVYRVLPRGLHCSGALG